MLETARLLGGGVGGDALAGASTAWNWENLGGVLCSCLWGKLTAAGVCSIQDTPAGEAAVVALYALVGACLHMPRMLLRVC